MMFVGFFRGGWRVFVGLAGLWLMVQPSAVGAQSGETKVAVIDIQTVLTDSVRGKEIIASLEKLRSEKMADLQTLQKELSDLQSRYTESRLSLSEEKLAELQKELEDKQVALDRAQQDAQRTMQKQQQDDFAKVERALLPIITAVGKEFGYSMIFNKFQSGLLYADDSIDITKLIIERFNETDSSGN